MRALLLLTGLAAACPAAAQTVTPLAEARLRYETADQAGLPQRSDAVTARARTGIEGKAGPWSAIVEGQGNLAIVGDYYDGLAGTATRPLVSDPQNVALYRAQIAYRTPALAVTAGRQRIALDDERFVGSIPFRQNGQTFDAIRTEWVPSRNLRADVSYVRAVRTIWGVDGIGARPAGIGGDTVLANLAWKTAIGTLTGFGYWIDEDQAAVQGFRLSSRTLGARLSGARALARARLAYAASYAHQTGYHRNPNDYDADYWAGDLALDLGGPRLGGGYEAFTAGDGRALTSFQTPLASNFKFNGWAEKFTTKPADGLRDLYGSAGWGWKVVGPLKAVSLSATYHRFESDRLVRHYGDELDFLAQAKLGRTTASLRYADYRADRFATDTQKLWLQLDWTI